MKIGDRHFRTLWLNPDGRTVSVIDQTQLPHAFVTRTLADVESIAQAIKTMVVRGAPLIGAAAAYGLALAMAADPSDGHLEASCTLLLATRPTAVNLAWAIARLKETLNHAPPQERAALAYAMAAQLCEDDVAQNAAIGAAGFTLIAEALAKKTRSGPVNILTHCNAGWLATVDWGTALAPVYKAHDAGLPVHVYVDETRPRNQGAALTVYELAAHGVPHTLIADNAGGHLMQSGEIDLCIVGADRVTRDGAVCNKIGTYLKALAARDCGVPFYVALPSPTIDWSMPTGQSIPIEERSEREVTHLSGWSKGGGIVEIALAPEGTRARNPAFDVTPARLVTGYITERGVAESGPLGLARLFPEETSA
ncbi:MAG: S-methyl-5-thioribose-1-phosphate isomerase [Burkholderiaceae bacterium]|jgi:methylthioribose-1-phosphate isomerase